MNEGRYAVRYSTL